MQPVMHLEILIMLCKGLVDEVVTHRSRVMGTTTSVNAERSIVVGDIHLAELKLGCHKATIHVPGQASQVWRVTTRETEIFDVAGNSDQAATPLKDSYTAFSNQAMVKLRSLRLTHRIRLLYIC
jgi:hypothetical protein